MVHFSPIAKKPNEMPNEMPNAEGVWVGLSSGNSAEVFREDDVSKPHKNRLILSDLL
jgi:hypothetical protein